MTNDTSTLNGALSELGETMADNLVSMGVTGASASDGLTTLANKILNIAPSVGGITPVTSIDLSANPSTVSVGGSVILSAMVNADYDDTSLTDVDLKGYLQGATITWKEGNTVLGTSVSDTNGVATYTVSNITNGEHTYTAIFDGTGTDYTSSTATITVTATTYGFEDTASTDNSSLYTSYPIQNTSGAVNISWDSSGAYKITNNTSSGRALVQFGNTVLQNNVKISADIKLGGTSYKQNGMLAFIDKDSQTTYSLAGWVQGQKYCRLTEFSGTSELQTTANSTWSSLDTSGYNHHELVYNNGVATYTITTPGNSTKTLTLTLQKSNYIGGKLGLFVEVFGSATHCYIKNIKVEAL